MAMYEITRKNNRDAEFERLLFVLKAVSDDTTRPSLCVVHAERSPEGMLLVGTDGRRLHVAAFDYPINEGDYVPVVTKTSVILKSPITSVVFPDWKRVVPGRTTPLGAVNLNGAALRGGSGCGQLSLSLARIIEKTGRIINLHYLDDLLKSDWELHGQKGSEKAIVFRKPSGGKETYAVIMPMSPAA
jgi:hypothetical protein